MSSPLRALSFRAGLDTLLQEGFDGVDYLSKEEVLSLVEEVLIFTSFFFNEENFDLTRTNPERVAGEVNTNPDFGNDTEFPYGFPVTAAGWVFKPRRKRDKHLANFFHEMFLVVSALRQDQYPATEVRLKLSEQMSDRLSRKVAKIGNSVRRSFNTTESGPAETLSSLEKELIKAFPGLANQTRKKSKDVNRENSRSQYSRRKRRNH